MVLRVEHLVRDPAPLEQRAQVLRFLDRDRAHQHRSALLVELLDLVDHRRKLRFLRLEHQVAEVLADHRLVGRDHHHIEVVDLAELVRLGGGGAGHAGEALVEAEVVLERDPRQRHVLALDAHPFLGLDRLVEPLAVPPAEHQPAGELIDDDDLAVLDDVVPVALIDELGLERLVQVVGELVVLRVVEVLQPQPRLDLGDAFFREADAAGLLLDEEVHVAPEPRHQPREQRVAVRGLLGWSRDDQWCPRLVDEDVVDLVDDGVVEPALHAVLEVPHHVVAQVVEAELVVGAVGDVSSVRFLA